MAQVVSHRLLRVGTDTRSSQTGIRTAFVGTRPWVEGSVTALGKPLTGACHFVYGTSIGGKVGGLPVCCFRYSGLALGLLRKASARQRRAWSDGGVDDLDRTVGEAPIAVSFPPGPSTSRSTSSAGQSADAVAERSALAGTSAAGHGEVAACSRVRPGIRRCSAASASRRSPPRRSPRRRWRGRRLRTLGEVGAERCRDAQRSGAASHGRRHSVASPRGPSGPVLSRRGRGTSPSRPPRHGERMHAVDRGAPRKGGRGRRDNGLTRVGMLINAHGRRDSAGGEGVTP